MVDVVWAVSMSVCAAVILVVTLYFHQKNQAELAAEEEERKRKHAAAVAATVGKSSGGKQLHLSEEQIQRDLDRLCLLFAHTTEPARKREAAKPPPEAPKPPPAAPKEVPKPPPAAPKEVPKPAVEPRRHKPAEARSSPPESSKTEHKARAEGSDGSEHIQSEIEQAVKETQ